MLMLKTTRTLRTTRAAAPHPEPPALDARTLAAATLTPADALASAAVTEAGLTAARAARLLEANGPNAITAREEKSLAARFAGAVATPFNGILLALAAISLYTDVIAAAPDDRDPWTVAIILTMVALSTALQLAQEVRGRNGAHELEQLADGACTVIRDGRELRVSVEEVVCGDVLALAAGEIVPADARVIAARDLFVNESALTGESAPVEKRVGPLTSWESDGDVAGSRVFGAVKVGGGSTGTDGVAGLDARAAMGLDAAGGTAATAPAATGAAAGADISDLANTVFRGTAIESGLGRALVTATGDATYLGRVAAASGPGDAPTAFDAGVVATSRVLVAFMLVMVPIVFVVNLVTKHDALAALLFSASVAVGITPQMLPAIVAACLSRGASALGRAGMASKGLSAIQNLGAMDVLCCDKTGTLTEDRVVMDRALDVTGHTSMWVLGLAYLNSRYQGGAGNLVDRAIMERVDALADRGERGDGSPVRALSFEDAELLGGLHDGYRALDELPFDFTRRRMSVAVTPIAVDKCPGQMSTLVTKGAVEEVLACCDRVELDGETLPLGTARRNDARRRAEVLEASGLRVIAVAYRSWDAGASAPSSPLSAADEQGLVLAGFIALLDPPRASAAATVYDLHALGVGVKVLTGDAPGVAASICERVGIDASTVLTGHEVDALDDEALAAAAAEAHVLARLSPLQKARVVRVLREHAGRTVGFMGDGINDAAALSAADCGIAVAGATDVAREAADLVMADSDLGVLVRGVREGRRTYGNLIKYIKLTASGNFGNVFSVLAASAALPFIPMNALQLLALSLIAELVCATLPWDRVDPGFCRAPRTWRADGIARFMLRMGPASSLFDILTFSGLFGLVCPAVAGGTWAELAGAGDAGALALFTAAFQTGWFIESLWTQALAIHTLRGRGFHPAAPVVIAATLTGCALGTALPWTPLARALGLTALPGWYFGLLAVLAVGYLGLMSLAKRLYIRRHGELL